MFDLAAVRRVVSLRPSAALKPEAAAGLLEDARVDMDAAKTADTAVAVPVGLIRVGRLRRHLLLDGYEIVQRCVEKKRPVRVRLLSEAETRSCVSAGSSFSEWPPL